MQDKLTKLTTDNKAPTSHTGTIIIVGLFVSFFINQHSIRIISNCSEPIIFFIKYYCSILIKNMLIKKVCCPPPLNIATVSVSIKIQKEEAPRHNRGDQALLLLRYHTLYNPSDTTAQHFGLVDGCNGCWHSLNTGFNQPSEHSEVQFNASLYRRTDLKHTAKAAHVVLKVKVFCSGWDFNLTEAHI